MSQTQLILKTGKHYYIEVLFFTFPNDWNFYHPVNCSKTTFGATTYRPPATALKSNPNTQFPSKQH